MTSEYPVMFLNLITKRSIKHKHVKIVVHVGKNGISGLGMLASSSGRFPDVRADNAIVKHANKVVVVKYTDSRRRDALVS